MNVKERIAYVRGLVEGSEFHGRDEQARAIWANLLLVCDTLADSIDAIEDSIEDVEEYLEALDLDLADLEDVVDDDVLVEVECQHCGEESYFEEDFLHDNNAEIMCPTCGSQLNVGDGHAITSGAVSIDPADSVKPVE